MSTIGMKFYFIVDEKIIKVGLDNKKRFTHLAGKKVPWVSVTFTKDENIIIDIRIDPAYINLDGYWTMEIESKRVASVLDKIFQPIMEQRKNDNVVSFTHRRTLIKLTDYQKELLKKRIDHDFGTGTWDTLLPSFKVNLWSKGRTS